MWLVEVALACKIEVQIWVIFGLWNMGKVELQDDLHSVSSYIITSSITYLSWEKKAQLPQEIWSIRFEKKGLALSNVQTVESTLWTHSQHCIALLAIYFFLAIIHSEIQALLRVPLGPVSAVSNFQLLVQIWAEHQSATYISVYILYYFGYTLIV